MTVSDAKWAQPYVDLLLAGQAVTFVAVGDSMKYLIPSGSTVRVVPINDQTLLCIGMVVLVELGCGRQFLHQIGDIDDNGDDEPVYVIQTTRGREDGRVKRGSIFGVCVSKQPPTET